MSLNVRFPTKNFALFSLAISAMFFVGPIAAKAADAPKDDDKKSAAKSDAKVIKPEQAKDYLEKEAVVEFKVAGAREVVSGVCFLNSTTDREDPAGFTAFIGKKGLTALK